MVRVASLSAAARDAPARRDHCWKSERRPQNPGGNRARRRPCSSHLAGQRRVFVASEFLLDGQDLVSKPRPGACQDAEVATASPRTEDRQCARSRAACANSLRPPNHLSDCLDRAPARTTGHRLHAWPPASTQPWHLEDDAFDALRRQMQHVIVGRAPERRFRCGVGGCRIGRGRVGRVRRFQVSGAVSRRRRGRGRLAVGRPHGGLRRSLRPGAGLVTGFQIEGISVSHANLHKALSLSTSLELRITSTRR